MIFKIGVLIRVFYYFGISFYATESSRLGRVTEGHGYIPDPARGLYISVVVEDQPREGSLVQPMSMLNSTSRFQPVCCWVPHNCSGILSRNG